MDTTATTTQPDPSKADPAVQLPEQEASTPPGITRHDGVDPVDHTFDGLPVNHGSSENLDKELALKADERKKLDSAPENK